MRARIKQLMERRLGVRVYRHLPYGVDVLQDMRALPGWSPSGVFFDVGGNIGQTALKVAAVFPEAPIYSFEPAPHMYEQLTRRTGHLPTVRRFDFAFGAGPGAAPIFLHRRPGFHTMRADLHEAPNFKSRGEATVQVRTIDDFTAEQGIDFVQFLKIDTEGFDLEVLKGADASLRAQRIGVVQVECGFEQDGGKFIPLETFRTHLRERGYLLHGIYEQLRVHKVRLRRCNATFISERFAGSGA